MKLCNQCVVKIGENETTCPFCKNFTKRHVDWDLKKIEFEEILKKHKKEGSKYDAIVPLSGGKDSSFVLYYLTKVLNAKVLALVWDNYFMEEGAWTNIEKAVKATNTDLRICKWDIEAQKSMYRAYFKQMGRVCYCLQWTKMVYISVAAEENVSLVITGESEGQREMDHSFEIPDQKTNAKDIKAFYSAFKRLMTILLKIHEPKMKQRVMHEVFDPVAQLLKQPHYQDKLPIFIPLANYVDWSNKKELKEILETELNWKNPVKMFVHTNCWLEPMKGYMEYRKNLNETLYELSHAIRLGGITREEAIEDMKHMYLDGSRPDATIKRFCEFIGITEEEFERYIGKREMFENRLLNWLFSKLIEPKVNKIAAWHFGLKPDKLKMFSVHGIGKI